MSKVQVLYGARCDQPQAGLLVKNPSKFSQDIRATSGFAHQVGEDAFEVAALTGAVLTRWAKNPASTTCFHAPRGSHATRPDANRRFETTRSTKR